MGGPPVGGPSIAHGPPLLLFPPGDEEESLLESSPRYSSGMDPVQLAEPEDESLLESSRQYSDGMDP